MADGAYRRKNYIIKKRFQFKYILAVVGTLGVVMIATALGLYAGMWGSIIENFSKFKVSQNLENAKRIADYESARYRRGDYRLEKIFREAELLSAEERATLKKALVAVNRSLAPKVVILAFIIFLGGIFLSHKIAGPIYRIERTAAAIREGDLTASFHTRRGDDIKETTDALQEMVASLRTDIDEIKAASINLDEIAKGSVGQLSEEDANRMRRIIRDIDRVLGKYKT